MAFISLPRAAESSRLEKLADAMAAAAAASLPWSTSVSSILLGLWLLSLLPVRDLGATWRAVLTPAGGLPVLLFALAALGTLWSEASWPERLEGLEHFLKLLAIPILLAQFRRSPRADWVLYALLASTTALLALASLHAVWPDMPLASTRKIGVPMKDHLSQGALFSFAAFVLLQMAVDAWREGRPAHGSGFALLACAFLAHLLAISTGRTALVAMAVLLVLFCLRQASLKLAAAIGLGVVLIGVGTAWNAFPYLRSRIDSAVEQLRLYETQKELTSAGLRIEFLKNAVPIVSAAPVLGHGTGSIREAYQWAMDQGYSRLGTATTNPHNQVLAVAIQLGLLGVILLAAMWLAHAVLFFPAGNLLAWAGTVVVAQNIVSSAFNSHLQDFTTGWFYVLMVGALGGAMLRQRDRLRAPDSSA